MENQRVTERKIYFDLDADMQRQIARLSLDEVLRGQGVEIPPGLRLGEEALPAEAPDFRERDWVQVLGMASELAVPLAAALSMIILAVSKFLKDREHAPKVLSVHRVIEELGPDGERRYVREETPIVVEHSPQSRIALEAALKDGKDLVVKFTAED